MTIDQKGNVGIGTITPASALDIRESVADKGITIRPADGGIEYTEIKVSNSGSVTYYANDNMVFSSDLNLYFRSPTTKTINLADQSNANILMANGGGNVGIGSTAPGSKLDVTGGAARILTGTSTPSVDYAVNPGDLYVQNNLEIDGNVYLGDAVADNLIVAGGLTLAGTTNYTGNVGINSASPYRPAQCEEQRHQSVPDHQCRGGGLFDGDERGQRRHWHHFIGSSIEII